MQPAFPSPGVVLKDGTPQGAYTGMTLRDYFAAQAMQAHIPLCNTKYYTANDIAELSYKMATAMLRARGG